MAMSLEIESFPSLLRNPHKDCVTPLQEDDDSTTCSPASSPPSSPRKGTDKAGSPRDDGFQSEDDSETLVTGMASEHTQTSLEKYKKCLKLTTEQIVCVSCNKRCKGPSSIDYFTFSFQNHFEENRMDLVSATTCELICANLLC